MKRQKCPDCYGGCRLTAPITHVATLHGYPRLVQVAAYHNCPTCGGRGHLGPTVKTARNGLSMPTVESLGKLVDKGGW